MAEAFWVPENLERIPDVPFTRDDDGPSLFLDLYRPRARFEGPRPVVVWIHGGGWRSGDKERGVERIFDLVAAGFVGVSIDYRLSQDALFPAQLHDCKCAVRFLRAHAEDWDVDPRRIGAWGASAGGHLASMLAVTGREPSLEGSRGWPSFSSEVQAACSWFGPSDLNLADRFPADVTPRVSALTADSVESRLVGGPVADRQELVAMANPIRWAHTGAAPVLLMHGARDDIVPVASSEALHAALRQAGADSHLHVIRGGHHNAWLWGDHHRLLVKEFFEWYLRPG